MSNESLSKISEFGIWLIQWFGDFSKDIKVLQIRTLNSIIRFLVAPLLKSKTILIPDFFQNSGIFLFLEQVKSIGMRININMVPFCN